MDSKIFTYNVPSDCTLKYQFVTLEDLISVLSEDSFLFERKGLWGVVRSKKFYAWLERIGEERFAREFAPFSTLPVDIYSEAAAILHQNIRLKRVDFSRVVGLDAAKTRLLETAAYPLTKTEISAKYGRASSGCVLLYGPPGCGKTYVAKALAGETSRYFIQRTLHEMVNKGRSTFAVARRLGGAILFIDEIEAIAKERDSEGLATRFLTNNLLIQLNDKRENKGIVVLGTTNEPWELDSAMIRNGRMDNLVYVGVPDAKTRLGLFKYYTSGLPMEEMDFSGLVERTDFYSCSDIESICYGAGAIPWREAILGREERKITEADFEDALKQTESTAIPWFERTVNLMFSPSTKSRFAPMVAEIERFRKRRE